MHVVRHLLGIVAVTLLALVLLYLTRFWIFTDWWGDEGLLGYREFGRQGDFLTHQLGGTRYQPFSLLLWLAGGIPRALADPDHGGEDQRVYRRKPPPPVTPTAPPPVFGRGFSGT